MSVPCTGDRGFAGTISLDLRGSGGQSFGCFLAGGIEVKLTGEANDYIGKGMAGGELVIVPPPGRLHHQTH
jgi:glutamate synthase (ferredoxin)